MSTISTLSERIAALKTEAPDLEEGWALIIVVCGSEEDRFLVAMTEDRFDDLLALGAMYRKKGRKADLLLLASQVWVSGSSDVEPCEDPDRKEVVSIVALGRDDVGQQATKIADGEWLEGPVSSWTAPLLAAFWKGYEARPAKSKPNQYAVVRMRWLTPPPWSCDSVEDMSKGNLTDAQLAGMLRKMHARKWLCAKPQVRRQMIQDFRREMKEEHRWN